MRTVRVIGTGGTIASRQSNQGDGAVASIGADALVASVVVPGVRCVASEVLRKGSYRFAEDDLRAVARAAVTAAQAADCDGVVVIHGTDTLEESAFLTDLVHVGAAPIVFCGAQRAADQPDADGPRNLEDAVRLAADPGASGLGVAICLASSAWPARWATKLHTSALSPFGSAEAGPLATVDQGRVRVRALPRREAVLGPGLLELELPRVELLTAYAGADGALLRAATAAGARGVVVAAFGIGNVTDDLAAAIREALAEGVAVMVSSRCAGGAVEPLYGGPGGGVELARAGAVFAGALRPSQARLLLAAGLSSGRSSADLADFVAPFL